MLAKAPSAPVGKQGRAFGKKWRVKNSSLVKVDSCLKAIVTYNREHAYVKKTSFCRFVNRPGHRGQWFWDSVAMGRRTSNERGAVRSWLHCNRFGKGNRSL